MKEQEFDKVIKQALQNLDQPYEASSWNDMMDRMDADDADAMDEVIKSHVESVKPRYQHTHWLQLKNWLDYAWYASNKVYVSKTAEAILMILALFTCFNYGTERLIPTKSESPSFIASTFSFDQSKKSVAESLANIQTESDDIVDHANLEAPPTKEQQIDNQTTEETFPTTNSQPNLSDQKKSLNSENQYINDVRPTQNLLTKNTFESKPTPIKSENTIPFLPNVDTEKLIKNSALESNQIIAANEFVPAEIKATNAQMINASRTPSVVSNIDQLNLIEFEIDENMDLDAGDIAIIATKINQSKWSISAFADLNFNHITTPYDGLYEKSGYNQNRVGTGGGLMVHKDVGPVELSTGLGYSSKQYDPQAFVELFTKSNTTDGTQFTFNGVNLNVVSIPVHATYFINKKGKWRTYASIGGAMHLALQAQYERDFEVVPQRDVMRLAERVARQGGTVTAGTRPKFEEKKFPDGILGDGSFKDNHYFTLDLAFGVERKLSPNTSLFAQPTVYYNLFNKGLSANNDIINTFAFQLGVKTRI